MNKELLPNRRTPFRIGQKCSFFLISHFLYLELVVDSSAASLLTALFATMEELLLANNNLLETGGTRKMRGHSGVSSSHDESIANFNSVKKAETWLLRESGHKRIPQRSELLKTSLRRTNNDQLLLRSQFSD